MVVLLPTAVNFMLDSQVQIPSFPEQRASLVLTIDFAQELTNTYQRVTEMTTGPFKSCADFVRETLAYSRLLGLCYIAGGLLSCAAPIAANYQSIVTRISIPPLNTETEVGLGEFLIQQGRVFENDIVKVNSPIKVGLIASYTINPGSYTKFGEDRNYSYFNVGPNMVSKSAISDPVQAIAVKSSNSEICVTTSTNASTCTESNDFTFERESAAGSDSFQKVLIYNGRNGSTINLGYREFSGNMARPAYSNEIQYNLDDSDIVGYQNARIRILEATNTYIRYVVLENFNEASF